jgi:hypothetical protein
LGALIPTQLVDKDRFVEEVPQALWLGNANEVIYHLAPEDQEHSWDTLDLETIGDLRKFINVDFSELEASFVIDGDGLKGRGEFLAGSAPVGIAVNDYSLLLLHDLWHPLIHISDLKHVRVVDLLGFLGCGNRVAIGVQ